MRTKSSFLITKKIVSQNESKIIKNKNGKVDNTSRLSVSLKISTNFVCFQERESDRGFFFFFLMDLVLV